MKVLCKELGFIELLCKEQIIIQFIFLNQFFFFFFFFLKLNILLNLINWMAALRFAMIL